MAGALFLPAYKKKVSMKDKEYNEIAVYPLPFDAARWIKTDWGPSDGEFLGESAKNGR